MEGRQNARGEAPTLDVLVPHYNDPAGLDLSLASIRNQTWRGDLRVLVVDDGSDSQAWAGVQNVCERSGLNVLLLRNDRNMGRPATRNRLLRESRGVYLAWLDAGDVWMPEKLSLQFQKLSQKVAVGADPNRLWVTCAYTISQPGKMHHTGQDLSGNQLLRLMQGDRLRAYLWTLLGRAEAFAIAGLFDERLPRMQDLDYWVRFVRGGGFICSTHSSRPLCIYHKTDVGRSGRQVHDSYNLIIDKVSPQLLQTNPGMIKLSRLKAAALGARFAWNNRDFRLALRYTLSGFVIAPGYLLKRSFRGLTQKLTRNG